MLAQAISGLDGEYHTRMLCLVESVESDALGKVALDLVPVAVLNRLAGAYTGTGRDCDCCDGCSE
jgi:hypothetical protein